MREHTPESRKKAARATAIAAFIIFCLTLTAFTAAAVLQIVGTPIHWLTYPVILMSGFILLVVCAALTPRKKSGATNMTDHPPQRSTSIYNSNPKTYGEAIDDAKKDVQ